MGKKTRRGMMKDLEMDELLQSKKGFGKEKKRLVFPQGHEGWMVLLTE